MLAVAGFALVGCRRGRRRYYGKGRRVSDAGLFSSLRSEIFKLQI